VAAFLDLNCFVQAFELYVIEEDEEESIAKGSEDGFEGLLWIRGGILSVWISGENASGCGAFFQLGLAENAKKRGCLFTFEELSDLLLDDGGEKLTEGLDGGGRL
jgi:hypothetical protein